MYSVDTLVLAGSYKEFLSWQQYSGVQRDKCLYIPDERAIKGLKLSSYHIVVTGTAVDKNTAFPFVEEELIERNMESSISIL